MTAKIKNLCPKPDFPGSGASCPSVLLPKRERELLNPGKISHRTDFRTRIIYLYLCLQILLSPTAYSTAGTFEELNQAAEMSCKAGDFAAAVEKWEHAYEQLSSAAERAELLVELAQAYIALGHYRMALTRLKKALSLAEKHAQLEAQVLGHLGNVYLALGPPDKARKYLIAGLKAARHIQDDALESLILRYLGNFHTMAQELDQAQEMYQQSLQAAQRGASDLHIASARRHLALSALAQGDTATTLTELATAAAHYQKLPAGHVKAQGLIRAGTVYLALLKQEPEPDQSLLLSAHALFFEASRIATQHHDTRMQAWAAGYMGRLYALEKRYVEALQLTRQAIWAAQQAQAAESLFLWEWQRGRLLMALGDKEAALTAYRRSVETLQPIREELAVSVEPHRDVFQNSIQPLFLELVDLLLQQASADAIQADALRREARERIEDLKEAQLRDYFQDACVGAGHFQPTPLEQVSPRAAIIYPIVLPERLELLISTHQGLRQHTIPVGAHELHAQTAHLQTYLEKRTTRQFLRPARQLYDWLIRPLHADLAAAGVDTLVFVPYGPLLTIPMAVLEDGQRFLVEKYALAIIPGLNLTDPQPLPRNNLRLLAIGLSEASQGFPALPFVESELQNITRLFGGRVLLNDQFRLPALKQALLQEPVTVLHIATHGQFESHINNTFLLTWDGKLSLDELDRCIGFFRFRDEPLELLTLSACQTAAGDQQAALGLAGVAIKAGARSALATLWFVNDQATADLVSAFYRHLQNPALSRAQALQQAQLGMLQDIRFEHPGYWAAFLLINNWL